MKKRKERLQRFLLYLWYLCVLLVAYMLGEIVWGAYRFGEIRDDLDVYTRINIGILVQAAIVGAVVILVASSLHRSHPVFEWGWPKSFGKHAYNLNLLPVNVQYIGPMFLVFLLFQLPTIARLEEGWFRLGTQDWADGIVRSLLFGFVHCLVGVPIAAAFAISVAGLWFTQGYFDGGVALSTTYHTAYNMIFVLIMLGYSIRTHIKDPASLWSPLNVNIRKGRNKRKKRKNRKSAT